MRKQVENREIFSSSDQRRFKIEQIFYQHWGKSVLTQGLELRKFCQNLLRVVKFLPIGHKTNAKQTAKTHG